MSEHERAALDHIRRVVDSVIGALPLPEITPVRSGQVNILPVPYIPLVTDGPGGINDAGAAAGAMIVEAYTDKKITPADFSHQSGQTSEAALSFNQISKALKVNGVTMEMRSGLKLADISLTLLSGRPAILALNHLVLQEAGFMQPEFGGTHFMVAVGLDVKNIFVHDPLWQDEAGEALGLPWLPFYEAWSQVAGFERAALVPRLQLVRRVKVTAATLNVRKDPRDEKSQAGTVKAGEVFEVTAQIEGWGKIGEERWVSLGYVTDL